MQATKPSTPSPPWDLLAGRAPGQEAALVSFDIALLHARRGSPMAPGLTGDLEKYFPGEPLAAQAATALRNIDWTPSEQLEERVDGAALALLRLFRRSRTRRPAPLPFV